jgi:hypothetical protein
MVYSFKKTLVKVGIITVEIVIAGLIALEVEKPEFMFLVPIFEGFRNWLKNRNK